MSQVFKTERRVEFRDTDAAGILHFTSYFAYMEEAEHALLRHLGTSVMQAVDDATLKNARREAIHELRADYKETDLFKVYQVPQDLGKIEMQAPELAEKAPALLRVRDAL